MKQEGECDINLCVKQEGVVEEGGRPWDAGLEPGTDFLCFIMFQSETPRNLRVIDQSTPTNILTN